MEGAKEYQPGVVLPRKVVELYLAPKAMDNFSLYSQQMIGDTTILNAAFDKKPAQNPYVNRLVTDNVRMLTRHIQGILDADFTLRRDGIAIIEPAVKPNGKPYPGYELCTPTTRSWGWSYESTTKLIEALFSPLVEGEINERACEATISALGKRHPIVLRFDPEARIQVLVRGLPYVDNLYAYLNSQRQTTRS